MFFTNEIRERILTELRKRTGFLQCPLCESLEWTMPDGYIALPLLEDLWSETRANSNLPCVALVCMKCGNTLLINLMQIGLGDLAQPEWGKDWGRKLVENK